jgi:hypothetical protein
MTAIEQFSDSIDLISVDELDDSYRRIPDSIHDVSIPPQSPRDHAAGLHIALHQVLQIPHHLHARHVAAHVPLQADRGGVFESHQALDGDNGHDGVLEFPSFDSPHGFLNE